MAIDLYELSLCDCALKCWFSSLRPLPSSRSVLHWLKTNWGHALTTRCCLCNRHNKWTDLTRKPRDHLCEGYPTPVVLTSMVTSSDLQRGTHQIPYSFFHFSLKTSSCVIPNEDIGLNNAKKKGHKMKRLKAGWGKGRRGIWGIIQQSHPKKKVMLRGQLQLRQHPSHVLSCHPPGRDWKNRHTCTDFYCIQIGLCLLHHMDYVNIDHYEWITAWVFDAIVSQAAWMVCACV